MHEKKLCRAISRLIERSVTDEVDLPANGSGMSDIVGEPQPRYGDRYKLSTVYGIFLMNFKEPKLEAKFRTDTVVADRENGRVVNPHFRQIYLQFPYFTKQLEECGTLYDKLIYALKNMNEWNRMPDALKEQVFKHLERLAAVANLSEANRVAYDKAVDRFYVSRIYEEDMQEKVENAMREGKEKGMREGREKGMQEGREEGIKEGREEGIREGIKEGRKEGRKEGIKEGREKGIKEGREKGIKEGLKEGMRQGKKEGRLEAAQNLKNLGISVDVIAKATGLSVEEVEAL